MTPATSTRSWLEARATFSAIVAILIITSLWIACGRFEHGQHADSLIFVLASLQRWTPYFWLQDRYGMLIPLLTIPIRNPLTNMMVQSAIGILFALSAGFFLVRYYFEDSPIWLAAAALQNVWFLLLAHKAVQFDWLVCLAYGPSFALGFAALVLSRRGAHWVALFLMLLSHWVNVGAYVVLLPLVVLRHLVTRDKRGLPQELGITFIGALVGTMGMKVANAPHTPTRFEPITVWPPGWLHLLQPIRANGMEKPHIFLLWMIIPAALGTAAVLFLKRRCYPLLVAGSLVITGFLNWLFVGSLVWVRMNNYSVRYVFPTLFLFSLALGVLAVAPFQNMPARYAGAASVAMTLLIFVSGAAVYGKPSRGVVQSNIDDKCGALTADVIASKATLVAGSYWTTWPAVFDANLMLYRRREDRKVYGLAYRDDPTLLDWALQRSVCVAAPVGDPESEYWMNISPRHFQYVRQINNISLYCEP